MAEVLKLLVTTLPPFPPSELDPCLVLCHVLAMYISRLVVLASSIGVAADGTGAAAPQQDTKRDGHDTVVLQRTVRHEYTSTCLCA